MNAAGHSPPYEIYPKRYFDASPTWFAWNKLTVADVCALREEKDFRGQGVYFWLNHPIRYVRLVGMVVQIDSVAEGRYTLVTLDDCSGASIELKIEKRKPTPGQENGKDDFPFNTLVDAVDVTIELGETLIHVNHQRLEVGAIMVARGTVANYMNQRQMVLNRISFVKDTNEEACHWSKVAHWRRTVLSSPWTLSKTQRQEVDEDLAKDEHKQRRLDKKKRKRDSQRAEKEKRAEEKRAALEREFNADAIKGSNLLPDYGSDWR